MEGGKDADQPSLEERGGGEVLYLVLSEKGKTVGVQPPAQNTNK